VVGERLAPRLPPQVSYDNEGEELELEGSAEYLAALRTARVEGYHLGGPHEPPPMLLAPSAQDGGGPWQGGRASGARLRHLPAGWLAVVLLRPCPQAHRHVRRSPPAQATSTTRQCPTAQSPGWTGPSWSAGPPQLTRHTRASGTARPTASHWPPSPPRATRPTPTAAGVGLAHRLAAGGASAACACAWAAGRWCRHGGRLGAPGKPDSPLQQLASTTQPPRTAMRPFHLSNQHNRSTPPLSPSPPAGGIKAGDTWLAEPTGAHNCSVCAMELKFTSFRRAPIQPPLPPPFGPAALLLGPAAAMCLVAPGCRACGCADRGLARAVQGRVQGRHAVACQLCDQLWEHLRLGGPGQHGRRQELRAAVAGGVQGQLWRRGRCVHQGRRPVRAAAGCSSPLGACAQKLRHPAPLGAARVRVVSALEQQQRASAGAARLPLRRVRLPGRQPALSRRPKQTRTGSLAACRANEWPTAGAWLLPGVCAKVCLAGAHSLPCRRHRPK
jgi:hypothetical protein